MAPLVHPLQAVLRVRRLPFFLLALLVMLPLSACRDAGDGPMAVVLTEETRGALELGMELPSLPAMVVEAPEAAPSEADRAVEDAWAGRWQASWLMEPSRGREVRQAVYDEAAGPLARKLGPEGVRERLDVVARTADAAADAELGELPPTYRARVDEARRLVERGREALDEGETAAALRAALDAADRMRTVSPEGVARSLLQRARAAASEDPPSRSEETRERIERLIRGADAAIEDGDFRRAIRRAFYACRLLGVSLAS